MQPQVGSTHRIPGPASSDDSLVRGAQALFVYHLSLFLWWTFVQIYYRVAKRVPFDPTPVVAFGSMALIVTALVVITRFAIGRRGTAVEGVARVAVALAVLDLVCEGLQFAPRLGLPALMPSGKDMVELVVRLVWVNCEFAMRIAVFVALWRTQSGADRRWTIAFFAMLGAQWVLAMLSFARSTEPYVAWFSAQTTLMKALWTAPGFGFAWLFVLVWLSKRVASGRHPAA